MVLEHQPWRFVGRPARLRACTAFVADRAQAGTSGSTRVQNVRHSTNWHAPWPHYTSCAASRATQEHSLIYDIQQRGPLVALPLAVPRLRPVARDAASPTSHLSASTAAGLPVPPSVKPLFSSTPAARIAAPARADPATGRRTCHANSSNQHPGVQPRTSAARNWSRRIGAGEQNGTGKRQRTPAKSKCMCLAAPLHGVR